MKRYAVLPLTFTFLLLLLFSVYLYHLNHYYDQVVVKATSNLGTVINLNETEEEKGDRDLRTIIHESQKKVVQVEVQEEWGESIGSGFIYNDKGDIITNAHVVEGAEIVIVKTSDAQKYPGVVIGRGDTEDIAVIRVPQLANIEPISMEVENRADIGVEVIALGSPLGLQNTVTTGIISGIDREFEIDQFKYEKAYQISAPITNGNSGGPLLDRYTGKVIAINSAGTQQASIGFSIPIPDVIDQITTWSKNAKNVTTKLSDANLFDNATKKITEDDARYLVGYFYESILIRDYVAAYALLGSEWQGRISYQSFRDTYLHMIDITITNVESQEIPDTNQVNVTLTLETVERTKTQETENSTYENTYIIGYENDQLKIFSVQKNKLQ